MRMKKKNTTIVEGMEKLKTLRKTQRELRKEIDAWREVIRNAGGDPDKKEIDLTSRNKEIYRAWKDGQSFKALGQVYKLSGARVSSICNRIEIILENKRHH